MKKSILIFLHILLPSLLCYLYITQLKYVFYFQNIFLYSVLMVLSNFFLLKRAFLESVVYAFLLCFASFFLSLFCNGIVTYLLSYLGLDEVFVNTIQGLLYAISAPVFLFISYTYLFAISKNPFFYGLLVLASSVLIGGYFYWDGDVLNYPYLITWQVTMMLCLQLLVNFNLETTEKPI